MDIVMEIDKLCDAGSLNSNLGAAFRLAKRRDTHLGCAGGPGVAVTRGINPIEKARLPRRPGCRQRQASGGADRVLSHAESRTSQVRISAGGRGRRISLWTMPGTGMAPNTAACYTTRALPSNIGPKKRKSVTMTNTLSAAHIVEALGDADVVVLTWPNGSQNILRGKECLARIAESGHSEPVSLARLPVSSDMEAEIIAAALQVVEAGGMGPAKVATLQRLLDQAHAIQ
jgi:hypothetical protein